jgi:hypothetical protein
MSRNIPPPEGKTPGMEKGGGWEPRVGKAWATVFYLTKPGMAQLTRGTVPVHVDSLNIRRGNPGRPRPATPGLITSGHLRSPPDPFATTPRHSGPAPLYFAQLVPGQRPRYGPCPPPEAPVPRYSRDVPLVVLLPFLLY